MFREVSNSENCRVFLIAYLQGLFMSTGFPNFEMPSLIREWFVAGCLQPGAVKAQQSLTEASTASGLLAEAASDLLSADVA
jgi:hypothetical protein